MSTLEQLQRDVDTIKRRNARVEADKAWETSALRRVLVALLTYCVAVLLFYALRSPRPWLDAAVPTVGFLLSTLSVSLAKRTWISWRERR